MSDVKMMLSGVKHNITEKMFGGKHERNSFTRVFNHSKIV